MAKLEGGGIWKFGTIFYSRTSLHRHVNSSYYTILARVKPWLYNMHCHLSKYDSLGCSCNDLYV